MFKTILVAYGLLSLIGSHPGLLLKDDDLEILKVNFVSAALGQFTPMLLIFSCKSEIIFYLACWHITQHEATCALVPIDDEHKICTALRIAIFKRKLAFP